MLRNTVDVLLGDIEVVAQSVHLIFVGYVLKSDAHSIDAQRALK